MNKSGTPLLESGNAVFIYLYHWKNFCFWLTL